MKEPVRLAIAGGATVLLFGLCLEWLPTSPLKLFGPGSLELLQPRALALSAFAPAVWWLSSRSLASLGARRRQVARTLRTTTLFALALALARPVTTRPARSSSTVFVVDVSDSVDGQALDRAARYIEQAQKLARPEQQLSLVTFARDAAHVALSRTLQIQRHRDGSATNIERALALARGLLAAQRIPQLVLFSDLAETHGALSRASSRLRVGEIALFLAPTTGSTQHEVGITALRLPTTVRAGESFAAQVELFTRNATKVSLRLLRDGRATAVEGERTLSLGPGSTQLSFDTQAHGAGTTRYRLELTPHGPDHFAENNQFERSTHILGPPRVLYVERSHEQAEPLAALLRAAGFEVDVRVASGAPQIGELSDVAFYILSDVPASDLSSAAMQSVVRFVDEGGGFLMLGGERSFGPGGYRGTPLEAILPVALDGSLQREEPTVALVLALDKSGSMAGEKLERAKEAALATAEMLGAENYLGVIGFDAEPQRVVRLAVARERSVMARSIATLAAGGGTALFPALDAAYADLAGVRARVKHVVVLTDGQSQEEALDALVRSMRTDGITVSAVGVGDDVNRGLLAALAQAGGGRAYFTRDPSRIPRLFAEEAQLVAHSPLVERELRAQSAMQASFLRGIRIEEAPPLHGFVTTRPREAPSELLLVGQRGDPLLARKRSGLGWSLAFTSDLKARWSSDWFRWRQLPAFVAKLIREHMRRERDELLAIATELEDDALLATIDVLSADEQFVNGLTGELHGTGPAGRSEPVPLRQIAPGRYQGRLVLPQLGSYMLDARLEREGVSPLLARGDFAYAFPAEYALKPHSTALPPGFSALPPPKELLAPQSGHVREAKERWPLFVWLAFAAFLLDLASRRLPEFDPKRRGEQTST